MVSDHIYISKIMLFRLYTYQIQKKGICLKPWYNLYKIKKKTYTNFFGLELVNIKFDKLWKSISKSPHTIQMPLQP